jgi:hypothetical protein
MMVATPNAADSGVRLAELMAVLSLATDLAWVSQSRLR